MTTARSYLGVDAAVERDDEVGQVGVGQDRWREIGDLGRLAEPADRYLPTQLCRVAGIASRSGRPVPGLAR
jgi:hypothetical protein